MSSKHLRVSILTLTLALGACTTSTGGGGSSAPSAAPSAAPSNVAVATLTATIVPAPTSTAAPTATPAPSAGGLPSQGPKPTPGAIDPCTLLTATEASAIIGLKVSAGVSTILDPDRVCTFKSGLSEVKLILAPPAPDAATAKAYWDAERAQVPGDIPIADLTYFDRSAYGSGSAAGISISALFVIQDNYFFDLFCGFPACSVAASVGGAQHIVGRLP